MTKNQIEYAKLLETRRANLRSEELTQADVRTRQRAADETQRANRAKESISLGQLEEERRKNLTSEQQRALELQERKRAAQQQEAISWTSLTEQQRHNQSVELESHRANIARETEQHRAATVQEHETERSHRANEAISYSQLVEAQRSHQANEALTQQQITESVRHALATETETQRAHLAAETEIHRSNIVNESIAAVRDYRSRLEQARHNLVTEQQTQAWNDAQIALRDAELAVSRWRAGNETAEVVIKAVDKLDSIVRRMFK